MIAPLPFKHSHFLLAFSLLVFSLISCSKKQDDSTPQPTIRLKSDAALGSFLVDGRGRTLYYYGKDVAGTNNCTGGCADRWPIFYEPTLQVGPGLNAADFTTGLTLSGQKQTFYKGWPLYYFATPSTSKWEQEPAGVTGGEGMGNDWFVARPDYTLFIAKGPVTTQSTGQTVDTKLYLVDMKGNTLYTYGQDARLPSTQASNCTGGCATLHPIFYSPIVAPSTLKSTDFGTITRLDGPSGSPRQQTTYKGQPLYYYANDKAIRGTVAGDGTGSPDQWSVATP
jgi:predicted lipoprotein with Yx(FWY)xxD motif